MISNFNKRNTTVAIVDTSTMDLTGADELFFRGDQRFMVYMENQTITFGEPVFANAKLIVTDVTNGNTVLVAGTDYVIPSTNNYASLLDTDATSQAKLQAYGAGIEFNDKLIKAIKITKRFTSEYQISVQYQALYKDPAVYSRSGYGPAYTPALMQSVLEKLDFLQKVKNPVTSVANDAVNGIVVMDIDYTGTNERNHIFNEEHIIDVVSNKFVIRPANGSFYHHDIDIRVTGHEVRKVVAEDVGKKVLINGEPITLTENNIEGYIGIEHRIVINSEALTEGSDYIIKGVNGGKTRASSHPSGVYDYIIVTKKIVGSVFVSYRAFGGEISISDINILKNAIIAINNILENGNFVTTENLPYQSLIISILDRLSKLEEFIRHYSLQQFPYTIQTFTHSNKNYSKNSWVDVAAIDHGPWSDDSDVPSIYTGSFKLDIESEGYYSEFDLKYNLSSGRLEVVNKKITATTYEADGIEYFTNRIVPKFRIVYRSDDVLTTTTIANIHIGKTIKVGNSFIVLTNSNINTYAGHDYEIVSKGYNRGVVLQMSINGPVNKTVNVNFYETSGVSGIWHLIDTNATEHQDTSLATTLPGRSGDETWVYGQANHEVTEIAVINDDNYTMFVGNIPVKIIDSLTYHKGSEENDNEETVQMDDGGMNIHHTINNLDVDVDLIKSVKFTIFDRVTNKLLVEETSQVTALNNVFNCIAMYFINDLCSIECTITRNDTQVYVNNVNETISNYSVNVKSRSGTNSLNNERFDLRKIDLVF